ncbi:hypothetical protein GCM10011391_32500 [Pullulanibacillus camelliae]|uniref:Uncharacterized protein n=1 Tax=Pullulanibacillus camelliae TaxID=1707096 RepID=A0A8J3DZF7_9BACL|nr:hypothetical protein [Pullulanibacillus camelliae]GGE51211.1 hypothetical protein GCM10011391_32500 [Pullulanibacillus camelliae]
MKPKVYAKKKRRDALKKWLKERLGSWQPKEKQSPTSTHSKLSA